MVARYIQQSLENSSWIRRMFEEGIRLAAQVGAENVYDFSLGNPDVEPPEEVLASMARHIRDRDAHKYMPNAGLPAVRAKVAAHMSRGLPFSLGAEHIVMTVGAAGGLNAALKALLDPGDEVIVLAPYFAEYLFYIRNHGGVPVIVPTREGTFAPDVAAVAAAITPRTRAIILNSPNNPTGVIYSREDLEALAAVLPDEVCVLSDEPYAKLVYDGTPVPNVLSAFQNVMVINSFSKSLAKERFIRGILQQPAYQVGHAGN
jgi:aspartate aminotransferase